MTDPQSPPATVATRRRWPAAAVFLTCLAAGALAAVSVRVLAPDFFEGSSGAMDGESGTSLRKTRGRLELREERYDYGEILDGAHAVHRFEFRNAGTEPLTIAELVKPCSCIAFDGIGSFDSRGSARPADSTKEKDLLTLEPEQRGYLDIRMFPAGAKIARERRQQSIHIVTNGLGHERVFLELSATFLYVIGVEVRRAGDTAFRPSLQREVDLGALGRNEAASFWIDVIDLEQGAFDITGEILLDGKPWQSGPPYFAITVEDAERLGVARKRLVLDVGGLKPVGRIQHELLVPTSIHGGHPVRLQLRGLVAGDLYLETLTGQREALQRVSFGVLQPDDPTSLRRTITYVGTRDDLALGPVEIRREGGGDEPALDVKVAPAGARRWTLEVTLPRGASKSFLADLVVACTPTDAVPAVERTFQVQGIVPQRAAAKTGAPAGLDVPRLLPDRAREEVGTVVHGRTIEVAFGVANPSSRALSIRRALPFEGPPLRFLRAEIEPSFPAATEAPPAAAVGANGPQVPPLVLLPARSRARLVFALDTLPLVRGIDAFVASAEVESDDAVTPRVVLSVRGKVDYPAGLFGSSADAPNLVLPLQEIWLPPVGRSGALQHEVELRPTRAWDGSFSTTIGAAAGVPWPSFLAVSAEERTDSAGARFVALRFAAAGDKSPSAFFTRVRIETAIGAGYAFEAVVRGDVVDDWMFVNEEPLRDRHGPNGELLVADFVRPIAALQLSPARLGEALVREQRIRYLGGRSGVELEPQPLVRWLEPADGERPGLEVAWLPPQAPEQPDGRCVLRLPQGAKVAARGEIELREAGSQRKVLTIPFAIELAR